MKSVTKIALAFSVMAWLGGCASSGVHRAAENQFVTEFYAYVHDVREVKFKSYAGEAAAVGAVDGMISSIHRDGDDILRGALWGGLIAGALTALFEGDNRGFEYDLDAVDGDTVTVIIDHQPATYGDCVKVRVAGEVSLNRVDGRVCELEAEAYY
ncbi:hypothetical protein [Aestuariibacter salexigens]|uniref:hypothetical protein n=1 Tax=Aestuariibacter salexigens TaxID=226010 RepID=UPI0003FD8205|nr:hypothetical protein [Aestuariibacter salexigens]